MVPVAICYAGQFANNPIWIVFLGQVLLHFPLGPGNPVKCAFKNLPCSTSPLGMDLRQGLYKDVFCLQKYWVNSRIFQAFVFRSPGNFEGLDMFLVLLTGFYAWSSLFASAFACTTGRRVPPTAGNKKR